MTETLTILSILGYAGMALVTARRVYGRWRAQEIDRLKEYGNARDPVSYYNARGRRNLMAAALNAGLFWPATLTVRAVTVWMESSPVRSAYEAEALSRRIADLEEEMNNSLSAALEEQELADGLYPYDRLTD